MAIEEIYEQTLASLSHRYGKRIAYFQSLPLIVNLDKAVVLPAIQTKAICPILG